MANRKKWAESPNVDWVCPPSLVHHLQFIPMIYFYNQLMFPSSVCCIYILIGTLWTFVTHHTYTYLLNLLNMHVTADSTNDKGKLQMHYIWLHKFHTDHRKWFDAPSNWMMSPWSKWMAPTFEGHAILWAASLTWVNAGSTALDYLIMRVVTDALFTIQLDPCIF